MFDYLAAGKPILSDIDSGYNLVSGYECGIVTSDSVGTVVENLIKLEQESMEVLNMYGYKARELAKKYDYKELTDEIESILLGTLIK